MRIPCKKASPKKEEEVMLDPKHLIAQVVNETVKWAAIGFVIVLSIGIITGVLLSLYFR
jgi:hypothetical protein